MQVEIVFFAFLWALVHFKRSISFRSKAFAAWPHLAKWFDADPAKRESLLETMELVEDVVNQVVEKKGLSLEEFKKQVSDIFKEDDFKSLLDDNRNIIKDRIDGDPSSLIEKNLGELWKTLFTLIKETNLNPTEDQLFSSFCKMGSSIASEDDFQRRSNALKNERRELANSGRRQANKEFTLKKKDEDLDRRANQVEESAKDVEKRKGELAKERREFEEVSERFREQLAKVFKLRETTHQLEQSQAEVKKLQEEVERLKDTNANTDELQMQIKELSAFKEDALSSYSLSCQICQCSIKQDDKLGTTSCGHIFHIGCINHWLETPIAEGRCPACRTKVNADVIALHT